MVLDLDPGHDLEQLKENVGPIPETNRRQRTPRGGEHLFFELKKGEVVSCSASKVADNVDVRSTGGYVLLAPSETEDGPYVWEGTGKPSYRTDEMVEVANSHREKHEDRDTWEIEPDQEQHIELAIESLRGKGEFPCGIAIEGQGGDHKAYATGAMMKSFGISLDTAIDLIFEHWNPRCDPPWDHNEEDHLIQKIENAYMYNTSPPGNVTEEYKVKQRKKKFTAIIKTRPTPEGSSITDDYFTFTTRS
jgi:hypothetical protein